MSRHDFSRNTVELISSQIEALKRLLEESILSLEDMPFSWRNISFNGAIQWAETLQVRNDRNRMSTVLQNALTAYGQKVGNIEQMDDTVSKAIEENADHLHAVAHKLQQLVHGIHKDPSVPGSYAGLRATILNLDKSHGTLDFERMTDAEREQYYQDCINMDPKDVTETDRRLMQEYCETYLESKVEIKDGMSETAKANRDKYNALYEKAYPDEAAKIQTFFDNSAKDGITADDVANIKAIAYASDNSQYTMFCIMACKKASDFISQGITHFTHKWDVYNEVDFDKMSVAEFEQHVTILVEKRNAGTATDDDKIRLKASFDYISENSLENKQIFLMVYEKVYPEKMQAIRESISELALKYDTEFSEEKIRELEYYMTNGTSISTAELLCRELSRERNIVGDQYQLLQFSHGEGFYQGNFWIGNFSVSQSVDGTCEITAVARQSPAAKSQGAVIVYDEFGRLTDIQILNRYKNPTDLVSAVTTIYKDIKGENYEETRIDIKIPYGGYAQITDDPDVLEYIQGDIMILEAQQLDTDAWLSAAELTNGDIKIPGQVEGAYVEYGDSIQAAIDFCKFAAETVDNWEARFWTAHQDYSGSCYIYNH